MTIPIDLEPVKVASLTDHANHPVAVKWCSPDTEVSRALLHTNCEAANLEDAGQIGLRERCMWLTTSACQTNM